MPFLHEISQFFKNSPCFLFLQIADSFFRISAQDDCYTACTWIPICQDCQCIIISLTWRLRCVVDNAVFISNGRHGKLNQFTMIVVWIIKLFPDDLVCFKENRVNEMLGCMMYINGSFRIIRIVGTQNQRSFADKTMLIY